MATNVIMPALELAQETGKLLRWIKAPGDTVRKGEPIAEIETDKANVEIEAFGAGVFRKVLSQEGAVVPVGTIIAVIAAAEDDIAVVKDGGLAGGDGALRFVESNARRGFTQRLNRGRGRIVPVANLDAGANGRFQHGKRDPIHIANFAYGGAQIAVIAHDHAIRRAVQFDHI